MMRMLRVSGWVLCCVAVGALLALPLMLAQAAEEANPGGWPYEGLGDARYQYVWLKNQMAGEDLTLNHQRVSPACKMTRYTTPGDQSVKPTFGTLCAIMVWAGTSVTATLYDNAGATCNTGGTQLSPAITLTTLTRYEIQGETNNGLCITIGGTSPDVLVFWR